MSDNVVELRNVATLAGAFSRSWNAQIAATDDAERERLAELAFDSLETAVEMPVRSQADARALALALDAMMAEEGDGFTPYPAGDQALKALIAWLAR